MNRELAHSIGSAAREARLALRLTQEDAAEKINICLEFYARIECGTSLPSIVTFARMAAVLGLRLGSIIGNDALPARSSWMPVSPDDPPDLRRLAPPVETTMQTKTVNPETEQLARTGQSPAPLDPRYREYLRAIGGIIAIKQDLSDDALLASAALADQPVMTQSEYLDFVERLRG